MQCLKTVEWKIDQPVRQKIKAKLTSQNGEIQTWKIKCILFIGEEEIKLATFEWKGSGNPLEGESFYRSGSKEKAVI